MYCSRQPTLILSILIIIHSDVFICMLYACRSYQVDHIRLDRKGDHIRSNFETFIILKVKYRWFITNTPIFWAVRVDLRRCSGDAILEDCKGRSGLCTNVLFTILFWLMNFWWNLPGTITRYFYYSQWHFHLFGWRFVIRHFLNADLHI